MYDDVIHVTVPGSPNDPRVHIEPPSGVVFHYVPELHPDDCEVVDGIRMTTVARTLIDLAETEAPDELREIWQRAFDRGLVTTNEIRASYGRVEWRPSLATVRQLLSEFEA